MTTATRTPKRRTPPPFDPHLASFIGHVPLGEYRTRLSFQCPSRRPGQLGYLLVVDEDGGKPSCSCDGATRWGHCTHMDQAAAIVRLAFENSYAGMDEPALIAADRALLGLLGPRCGESIRYQCLGDELAKRARMKDRPLLNLRGQRAKSELFGG